MQRAYSDARIAYEVIRSNIKECVLVQKGRDFEEGLTELAHQLKCSPKDFIAMYMAMMEDDQGALESVPQELRYQICLAMVHQFLNTRDICIGNIRTRFDSMLAKTGIPKEVGHDWLKRCVVGALETALEKLPERRRRPRAKKRRQSLGK